MPAHQLIVGGQRSGKSRHAERLELRWAARPGHRVSVIATAEAHDDEMRARIARHRADRPAGFDTIEAPLALKDGEEQRREIRVPEALADILREVDSANRLAAKAAEGDREALRSYVETDPALAGLDRLYCLDVADALIRMHEDVLTRF